jgi:hypothetical protein
MVTQVTGCLPKLSFLGCLEQNFQKDWGCLPYFLFSWVKIRLHTEIQLPWLPQSALIVMIPGVVWCGDGGVVVCLPITRPPQQELFYIVLGCWMGCGNIPFEGGSSCFGTSGPTVFFSLQPNRLPWSQKKSLHFLYLFFIFHFSFQRFFIICISNNNIIGEKVRKCWTFIYLKRIFHTYFVMSIWVYSEIRKMSSLCIFVMLDYHKSYL